MEEAEDVLSCGLRDHNLVSLENCNFDGGGEEACTEVIPDPKVVVMRVRRAVWART